MFIQSMSDIQRGYPDVDIAGPVVYETRGSMLCTHTIHGFIPWLWQY
jgi:hypothetical protein